MLVWLVVCLLVCLFHRLTECLSFLVVYMSQRLICCVGCIHSTFSESPIVLHVSRVRAVPDEPSAGIARLEALPLWRRANL